MKSEKISAMPKILIVDDDPAILYATARTLQTAGYPVHEARTGEECLRVAREKSPDLILLDVILPDFSGYEVCRRIKADKAMPGIYVLMLSGRKTSSDDQSEGLEMGADGYITRPLANRELLARVQSMARIIRAERERDHLIEELQKAMAEIKTLSGLLPICANCKKIRDDKGYWENLESYIMKHSNADFTHSICSECLETLYGISSDEEDAKNDALQSKDGADRR